MASTLSGPIPQHPMYGKNGLNDSFSRSAPRVKPEASSYYQHGISGTVGNLFTVTGTSFGSSAMFKPKKQPKDHVSENVKRMRQIQRKCRQMQHEEETRAPTPVKALWKSQKYENVPSKLADFLHQEPATPRPSSANYLRAHSKTGLPPRPQSSRTPRARSPAPQSRQPPVDRLEGFPARSSSCSDLSAVGKQLNFVKLNAMAASRQQVKRSPSVMSLETSVQQKADKYDDYKRKVKGSIPKYLEKRREEWKQEEEDRIRNMPDPDQPPGHKLMSVEERLETLSLLQKSYRELSAKLSALPIRSDTLRIRRTKEELENKMGEVEEAIKIFSRPKVFVKVDD